MRSIDPAKILRAREAGGAPPFEPTDLHPGLSPSELRAALVEGPYPFVAEYVDETIEAWWSFHNGPDLARIQAGRPSPFLTPEPFELCNLQTLFTGRELVDYAPMGAERYPHLTQFFPISHNEMGEQHWLGRAGPDDPWTIWWADFKAEIIPPHRQIDGPPVLFMDYLEALLSIDQPWKTLPIMRYPWR